MRREMLPRAEYLRIYGHGLPVSGWHCRQQLSGMANELSWILGTLPPLTNQHKATLPLNPLGCLFLHSEFVPSFSRQQKPPEFPHVCLVSPDKCTREKGSLWIVLTEWSFCGAGRGAGGMKLGIPIARQNHWWPTFLKAKYAAYTL